ncbi:TPA: hypothetical protein IGM88_004203 [Escherichia coli]|nr:hypothetical protein [Escherichia coli]HAN7786016.1 hypothetical protein [Escherichia coli]HAN8680853.1 hypothetical protein [Escherichia coli]
MNEDAWSFRVVGLVQVARRIWSLSVNREVRSERNELEAKDKIIAEQEKIANGEKTVSQYMKTA